MTTYIARRLIQTLIVIILVSFIIFFVIRLLPGDPLQIYLASSSDNIQNISPETLATLRHQFGLDKPVVIQYFNWLWGIITRGDFGSSIIQQTDVSKLMKERFPVTIYLGVLAFILGTVLGISGGLLAAIRRGKWIDKIVTPIAYVGITIPVFWLGILFIYSFGLMLHWLPTFGYTSPLDNLWLSIKQAILPVVCLSVFGLAANCRQMRSSMLEVIRQDYIRTAWSKGLKENVIILRHALKISLIPVITVAGLSVNVIFGGSVLVETVFAIPGVGKLLVSSILGHDYLVVQGITLVITIAIALTNLIIDVSYGFLDPRIRYK